MKIWKFEIPNNDLSVVDIPKDAKLLSVGIQDNKIMVWAIVEQNADKAERVFRVTGTGHEVNDPSAAFIGTVFMDSFVWHVFDGGEL